MKEGCRASLCPPPPSPHLRHDHVLTLLHVLALSLDDGVEEVEVVDVAAVGGQAVDEVLQDALRDLVAQLVVVTEDVLHCLRLQQLHTHGQISKYDKDRKYLWPL